MSISSFMKVHGSEIKNIISDLPNDFSSHDFIEKFSKSMNRNILICLYSIRVEKLSKRYMHK